MEVEPPQSKEETRDWFGPSALILLGLVVGAAISAGAITLTDPASSKIAELEERLKQIAVIEERVNNAESQVTQAQNELAKVRSELRHSQNALAESEAKLANQAINTKADRVETAAEAAPDPKDEPEPPNHRTFPRMKASYLVAEYNGNEIHSDEEFKDKWIKVDGKVSKVGRDLLGDSYVTLSAAEDSITEVQCYFNAASVLSSLSVGDDVTIAGVCGGKSWNVIMRDCQFAD